mmetsp:Transcript_15509/g.46894  ORF Transcript_15509/g.46894 Transcript_15509/m.46894 type:complete len:268 (-) Transcript_15509:691-1494(-)
MMSATASGEKSVLTRRCPASAMVRARTGSRRTKLTASASCASEGPRARPVSGSSPFEGSRTPASPTSAATPEWFVATTGSPEAMASCTGRPQPSPKVGKTNTSARRYRSRISNRSKSRSPVHSTVPLHVVLQNLRFSRSTRVRLRSPRKLRSHFGTYECSSRCASSMWPPSTASISKSKFFRRSHLATVKIVFFFPLREKRDRSRSSSSSAADAAKRRGSTASGTTATRRAPARRNCWAAHSLGAQTSVALFLAHAYASGCLSTSGS